MRALAVTLLSLAGVALLGIGAYVFLLVARSAMHELEGIGLGILGAVLLVVAAVLGRPAPRHYTRRR